MAKRVPGILTRRAIDEMNRLLVQHLGEEDSSIIKPVLLRYIRLRVTVKNVPPSSEEGVADFGLYNGSSSSARFPRTYGPDHAEGQG